MKKGEFAFAPNYVNTPFNGQSIIAAIFYPSYYDADQLFDLQNDPYEQENLAPNRAYWDNMNELKQVLQEHLKEFNHPFPTESNSFVNSRDFEKLVQESKKIKPESIDWYRRAWGEIIWPPEK